MIAQLLASKKVNLSYVYYVAADGAYENSGLIINDPINITRLEELELSSAWTVSFNRGDVFEDVSLDVNYNVTAHGSGNLPVFQGSLDISTLTWTDEGSDVWSTPMVTRPNWIFISGECAKQSETDWITIIGGSGNQRSFSHSEVSSYTTIVGSKIVMKDRAYSISLEREVTAYNGAGTLTMSDTVSGAGAGFGFKLYGLVEFFSGNNEWAWEDGVLYIKSTVSPSVLNIRQTSQNQCIEVNADNLNIENIEIQEYYQFGIVNNGNNLTIQNCNIHDLRDAGIIGLSKKDGCSFLNNQIRRVGTIGIHVASYSNLLIKNNTIQHVGNHVNYGWQTYTRVLNETTLSAAIIGSGMFIQVDFNDTDLNAENVIIENNNISFTAYHGVQFGVGENVVIKNNIVHDFLLRFTDGGGIYTFRNRTHTTGIDAEVFGNIVYNGIANVEGTPATSGAKGIYLDNRSANCHAHHNVVYNINAEEVGNCYSNGDTQNNVWEDNIVQAKNSFAQGFNEFDVTPIYTEGGNIIRRNIYAGIHPDVILHFTDFSNNVLAESDFNYYINPYTTNVYRKQSTTGNFAQLKAAYSDDANSVAKVNWLTYVDEETALEHVKLYTNETDEDITVMIPAGYEDIDGNDVSGQTLPVPSRFNGCPGLIVLKTAD